MKPRAEEVETIRERAYALLGKGKAGEAISLFRSLIKYSRENPCDLSAYGLSLALSGRQVKEGIALCETAVRQENYNPDLYWNLGRACVAGGLRAQAVDAFNKGLKCDRHHPGINREVRKMGTRRKPPLGFLPRGHSLNKVLGKATYRLRKAR
jgi:tetratricopeptide (TPR) repeat protein